jgi:hypothetical protein
MCLQDLLNFDDPLNVAAAEHYERDKVWLSQYPVCALLTAFLPQESFVAKVKEYVQRYANKRRKAASLIYFAFYHQFLTLSIHHFLIKDKAQQLL